MREGDLVEASVSSQFSGGIRNFTARDRSQKTVWLS